MIEYVSQPWHWAIGGLIIGLTVPTLLILGNKKFGLSSSLKHICAICIPAKIPFFDYDWKKEMWNLYFVLGIIVGGYIASSFFPNTHNVIVADSTMTMLNQNKITNFSHLMPVELFNWANLLSIKGFIFTVVGGFLVGFGTRYAGGCTSGHSIMGLSNLQWPSLIATVCFMAGGFISANLILPLLFKLQ